VATTPLDRSKTARWTLAWALGLAWAFGGFGGLGFSSRSTFGMGSSSTSDRNGLAPMSSTPNATSILVDYYEVLLVDGDVEGFRRNVSARYNDATLARLLGSQDPQARRASVLSLGLFGGFAQSNAAVAHALKDKDPTVRALAHDAVWAIWFRADSPENNESLAKIRKLADAGRFAEAIEQADRLIAQAPTFAEAYNQRAIAHFVMGRHAASASDCRLVLKHNPYHTGALSGLGQCLLQLGKRDEAIAVFRRASEIQPFDDNLRDLIARLEADR